MRLNNIKILVIAILLFSQKGIAQLTNLNKESWVSDIDYLVKKTQNIVPDFKSHPQSTEFLKRAELLKQGITSKSNQEILFEIQHLLNSIEDEGCNIIPFQKKLDTKVLPIKTYWFNDGLYICDASSNYNTLKGEKILKINDLDVDDVFLKLSEYINTDNVFYKKYLFSIYSTMPALLMSRGIGNFNDKILLEFASGRKATIKAESVTEYVKLDRMLPNDGRFSFTNTNHKNDNFWKEYIPNTNTLFVQVQKVVNNKKGISFSSFVKAIEGEIKKGNAKKIIIDVRYGGGGNGFKLKPFTDLLKNSKEINKKGNLFVLTSKATRGTLLELTSIISLNTKSIIIGEPTAEGPNTVGDTKYIKLPNSELNISLTNVFWPTSWNFDKRKTIKPDIRIDYSFNQYKNNEDPWILAVTNHEVISKNKSVPNNLINAFIGSYKTNKRKIILKNKNGKLFMYMRRKIKSFFEFETEIFYSEEGMLTTDIKDVTLSYSSTKNNKLILNWKGNIITLK